jgi:hypothetical protein
MSERSAVAAPGRPDAPTNVGARRVGPGPPEGGAERSRNPARPAQLREPEYAKNHEDSS